MQRKYFWSIVLAIYELKNGLRLWSRKAYHFSPPFANGLKGEFHSSLDPFHHYFNSNHIPPLGYLHLYLFISISISIPQGRIMIYVEYKERRQVEEAGKEREWVWCLSKVSELNEIWQKNLRILSYLPLLLLERHDFITPWFNWVNHSNRFVVNVMVLIMLIIGRVLRWYTR